MKAPQVIYLCLTTAFWLIGCTVAVSLVPDAYERVDDARTGGVMAVSGLVALNLALLNWGGFFKARD